MGGPACTSLIKHEIPFWVACSWHWALFRGPSMATPTEMQAGKRSTSCEVDPLRRGLGSAGPWAAGGSPNEELANRPDVRHGT